MTSTASTRYDSFAAFYPFYLSEHSNRTCRRLHFVGTSLALACLVTLLLTLNPWWLLAGPRLAAAATAAWPWVVAVALLSVLAWRAARRVASPTAHQLRFRLPCRGLQCVEHALVIFAQTRVDIRFHTLNCSTRS